RIGESPTAAGGKPDRHRLVGRAEVVHVDPVVWRGFVGGALLEQLEDRLLHAEPGTSGDVDVEALIGNLAAELDRLQRPFLPEHAGRRSQLRRGCEFEETGIALVPQPSNVEGTGRLPAPFKPRLVVHAGSFRGSIPVSPCSNERSEAKVRPARPRTTTTSAHGACSRRTHHRTSRGDNPLRAGSRDRKSGV